MTDDDLNEVVCAIALRAEVMGKDRFEVSVEGNRIAIHIYEVSSAYYIIINDAKTGVWSVVDMYAHDPLVQRLFDKLGVTAVPLGFDSEGMRGEFLLAWEQAYV